MAGVLRKSLCDASGIRNSPVRLRGFLKVDRVIPGGPRGKVLGFDAEGRKILFYSPRGQLVWPVRAFVVAPVRGGNRKAQLRSALVVLSKGRHQTNGFLL